MRLPFGRTAATKSFDNHFRGVIQRDGNVADFRYFGHSTDQTAIRQNFITFRNKVPSAVLFGASAAGAGS